MADNTFVRSVHDLSQAAWFGGALMGAVAIEAAARAAPDPTAVADAAWSTWHPVSNSAIVAHLVAGLGLTWANKGRIAGQRNAATVTAAKTGITLAALGVEAHSRRLGRELSETADEGSDVERQEREQALRRSQWALVALTGAVIAIGARMGEQQRPSQFAAGIADRLLPNR